MADNKELLDFIRRTEASLFRTDMDTGANPNALIVWNRVREFSGLPELTALDLTYNHLKIKIDDLIHAYAENDGVGVENAAKTIKTLAMCLADGETMGEKIRKTARA